MRGMETVATWLAYILDTPERQARRELDAFFAEFPRPGDRRIPPPLTKEEEEEQWRYIMAQVRADRKKRKEQARREAEPAADGRGA